MCCHIKDPPDPGELFISLRPSDYEPPADEEVDDEMIFNSVASQFASKISK